MILLCFKNGRVCATRDEPAEDDHMSHAKNLRADRQGFRAYLKVELHALLKALSEKDYEEALKYLANQR